MGNTLSAYVSGLAEHQNRQKARKGNIEVKLHEVILANHEGASGPCLYSCQVLKYASNNTNLSKNKVPIRK